MVENKKVKNASPLDYEGIHFKSTSEVMVYKTLLAEGFKPEYETHTYVLWEGFTPTVPFLTKNRFKRKDYRIKVISPFTVCDGRPLDKITYTPDFYFEYEGKKVIIEVKGFENDVFPYKWKMFKKFIEEQEDKDVYRIWEVFTKRQLLDCINLLKNENNGN